MIQVLDNFIDDIYGRDFVGGCINSECSLNYNDKYIVSRLGYTEEFYVYRRTDMKLVYNGCYSKLVLKGKNFLKLVSMAYLIKMGNLSQNRLS